MKLKNCWKKSKHDFLDCKRNLNFRDIFKSNTREFCHNTTLHGLRYVADKNLKRSERFFFGVSIVTVICIAIYLIVRVYNKWATNPVIVGINPEPNFITNEPFPAMTICNMNQAVKSKVAHYPNNSVEYAMLQLLCKRKVNTNVLNTIANWTDLEHFIVNISQSCEDMLMECRFGGRPHNCSVLFFPMVTDEGLCCVFNMLHPKFRYVSYIPYFFRNVANYTNYIPVNWNAETGYQKNLPRHFSPFKIHGVGESLGLSVALNLQKDQYYCSSSSSVGFKFAIHPPNEAPNVRETGIFIEPGKETKLRLKHEKIESAQHLRSIRKELRHCIFWNEEKLKFFGHYSQRNCEMECVAEVMLKHCGCVSYFMPLFHENISICSINQLHCEHMVTLRTDQTIKSCLDDCMPSCYDMNYNVDTFATRLSHNGFNVSNPKIKNLTEEYLHDNIAVVHMYFNEYSFRSYIQTEFIGISDFLSSIGGLMGLFLGFSFLSIAELIYYAIIRPCNAIQQYKLNRITECSIEDLRDVPTVPSWKNSSLQDRLAKNHSTGNISPYWISQDFTVKNEKTLKNNKAERAKDWQNERRRDMM